MSKKGERQCARSVSWECPVWTVFAELELRKGRKQCTYCRVAWVGKGRDSLSGKYHWCTQYGQFRKRLKSLWDISCVSENTGK